jgi:Fic/DOC family
MCSAGVPNVLGNLEPFPAGLRKLDRHKASDFRSRRHATDLLTSPAGIGFLRDGVSCFFFCHIAESADIIGMATAYTAGVVHDHPFVDGNKRTGFVVGILFLELNGFRFTASEADAAKAVLELAAGKLDEASYSTFLRTNVTREKK